MSWKIINQVLALASTDPVFWQELRDDPLTAVRKQGLELTVEEKEVFRRANMADLTLFSQYLLAQLAFPEAQTEQKSDDGQ